MVECRVRYLSFLGIGQNIKQCAFIMHTTQDLFIAHVFECDPSAGTLCKTIEAACKVCQTEIIQNNIMYKDCCLRFLFSFFSYDTKNV